MGMNYHEIIMDYDMKDDELENFNENDIKDIVWTKVYGIKI